MTAATMLASINGSPPVDRYLIESRLRMQDARIVTARRGPSSSERSDIAATAAMSVIPAYADRTRTATTTVIDSLRRDPRVLRPFDFLNLAGSSYDGANQPAASSATSGHDNYLTH